MIFSTVLEDTHGAASNVITIPETGDYNVTVNIGAHATEGQDLVENDLLKVLILGQ